MARASAIGLFIKHRSRSIKPSGQAFTLCSFCDRPAMNLIAPELLAPAGTLLQANTVN